MEDFNCQYTSALSWIWNSRYFIYLWQKLPCFIFHCSQRACMSLLMSLSDATSVAKVGVSGSDDLSSQSGSKIGNDLFRLALILFLSTLTKNSATRMVFEESWTKAIAWSLRAQNPSPKLSNASHFYSSSLSSKSDSCMVCVSRSFKLLQYTLPEFPKMRLPPPIRIMWSLIGHTSGLIVRLSDHHVSSILSQACYHAAKFKRSTEFSTVYY